MAFLGGTRVVPVVTTHYINNQSKSGITPSTSSQIIRPDENYTGLSQVTVNAIPASYIIPSGTYTVTNSGTYNISTYASVSTPAMANPTWTAATLNSSQAKVIYSITLSSGFKSNNQTFSSSYVLPSTAGTTVTPGDTSQIAVAAYQWTLGSIICGAIPSATMVYKSVYEKTIDDNGLTLFLDSNKSTVSSYFFQSCQNLTTLSNSTIQRISASGFAYCYGLTTINCPNLTSLQSSAFAYCTSLININLPALTSIGSGVFSNCTALSEVTLSNIRALGGNTFSYCSNLRIVNLPSVSVFYGEYNFQNCINLTSVSLPELISIYGSDFVNCKNLETISFPKLALVNRWSACFSGCSKLKSIYLMNSSMVYFSYARSENWKIFNGSPVVNSTYLGGVYASVYVPASLLATYKADSGWASISDRFVGI